MGLHGSIKKILIGSVAPDAFSEKLDNNLCDLPPPVIKTHKRGEDCEVCDAMTMKNRRKAVSGCLVIDVMHSLYKVNSWYKDPHTLDSFVEMTMGAFIRKTGDWTSHMTACHNHASSFLPVDSPHYQEDEYSPPPVYLTPIERRSVPKTRVRSQTPSVVLVDSTLVLVADKLNTIELKKATQTFRDLNRKRRRKPGTSSASKKKKGKFVDSEATTDDEGEEEEDIGTLPTPSQVLLEFFECEDEDKLRYIVDNIACEDSEKEAEAMRRLIFTCNLRSDVDASISSDDWTQTQKEVFEPPIAILEALFAFHKKIVGAMQTVLCANAIDGFFEKVDEDAKDSLTITQMLEDKEVAHIGTQELYYKYKLRGLEERKEYTINTKDITRYRPTRAVFLLAASRLMSTPEWLDKYTPKLAVGRDGYRLLPIRIILDFALGVPPVVIEPQQENEGLMVARPGPSTYMSIDPLLAESDLKLPWWGKVLEREVQQDTRMLLQFVSPDSDMLVLLTDFVYLWKLEKKNGLGPLTGVKAPPRIQTSLMLNDKQFFHPARLVYRLTKSLGAPSVLFGNWSEEGVYGKVSDLASTRVIGFTSAVISCKTDFFVNTQTLFARIGVPNVMSAAMQILDSNNLSIMVAASNRDKTNAGDMVASFTSIHVSKVYSNLLFPEACKETEVLKPMDRLRIEMKRKKTKTMKIPSEKEFEESVTAIRKNVHYWFDTMVQWP